MGGLINLKLCPYFLMVSIVIPVYNRCLLIERCVRSVMQQTYRQLEIILVDDGSTDGGAELMDTLAARDERLKVIHKTNGGVSSARNAGLDAATGQYVQFVDSDDELHPEATETAAQMMRQHEADVVIFGSNGQQLATGTRVEDRDSGDDFIADMMLQGSLCMPWNKLYRRDLIQDLRFNPAVSWGEDFIFNMSYLRRCRRAAFTNRCLYRQHTGNADSLCARYSPHGFADAKAQGAAVEEYLKSDALHPDAATLMQNYLWLCYMACVRKLCLRSGLSHKEIQQTLKTWAADSFVLNLEQAARSTPWDCRCVKDKHFMLIPLAVRLCEAKSRFLRPLKKLLGKH